MFEPQLTPKQQVKIQWARPPALLPLPIATAAPFQLLEVLQQLKRRQLRRRTLDMCEQKNGVAIVILIWGPPEGLGPQKRGTTHISSISITPVHKHLGEVRCNPTQGGFRRSTGAAQIGAKSNGKC